MSGCEYCRMEAIHPWGDYDMITDNGKYYITFEGVWLKIFFCPMCGRKLERSGSGE